MGHEWTLPSVSTNAKKMDGSLNIEGTDNDPGYIWQVSDMYQVMNHMESSQKQIHISVWLTMSCFLVQFNILLDASIGCRWRWRISLKVRSWIYHLSGAYSTFNSSTWLNDLQKITEFALFRHIVIHAHVATAGEKVHSQLFYRTSLMFSVLQRCVSTSTSWLFRMR